MTTWETATCFATRLNILTVAQTTGLFLPLLRQVTMTCQREEPESLAGKVVQNEQTLCWCVEKQVGFYIFYSVWLSKGNQNAYKGWHSGCIKEREQQLVQIKRNAYTVGFTVHQHCWQWEPVTTNQNKIQGVCTLGSHCLHIKTRSPRTITNGVNETRDGQVGAFTTPPVSRLKVSKKLKEVFNI